MISLFRNVANAGPLSKFMWRPSEMFGYHVERFHVNSPYEIAEGTLPIWLDVGPRIHLLARSFVWFFFACAVFSSCVCSFLGFFFGALALVRAVAWLGGLRVSETRTGPRSFVYL